MVLLSVSAAAQQTPTQGQYFFNQYLANPAFGGIEAGTTISGSVRKQFSSVPGGPSTQTITGEFTLGEREAVGFNLLNDKAGLLGRTRGVATFSYHLPITADGQKLHFGLGIGFLNERLNEEDIIGEIDPEADRFNQRKAYIDGSFGVAYTASALTVQGSIPNLKQVFTSEKEANTIDRTLFYSAVAYAFKFNEGADAWAVTPKIAYRGMNGIDGIVDAGVEFNLINQQLQLMSIYHSSKSASFGLGFNLASGLGLQAIYAASTSAMLNDMGNTFELNLRFRINKNR
jgi:type IX secretion system PorP/SprF family membrane protein